MENTHQAKTFDTHTILPISLLLEKKSLNSVSIRRGSQTRYRNVMIFFYRRASLGKTHIKKSFFQCSDHQGFTLPTLMAKGSMPLFLFCFLSETDFANFFFLSNFQAKKAGFIENFFLLIVRGRGGRSASLHHQWSDH